MGDQGSELKLAHSKGGQPLLSIQDFGQVLVAQGVIQTYLLKVWPAVGDDLFQERVYDAVEI
jgi:hypothetical protein